MNWVLSVLAGLAVAILVLYIINRNQPPVAIETYVQQPVRKGAPLIDVDSMLVAVGLQAIYTPRPSVMDASEISQDAWLAAQAAAVGGGPPAASTQPRVQEAQQEPPVGAGSGMAGAPMWSAGAVSGQTDRGAIQQVFLPGGGAIEQLITPPPTSSAAAAAAPRAKTAAEIEAEQDRAYQAQVEKDALLKESADAASRRAKIAALKAAAEQRYKEEWLPSRSGNQRTDTVANRAAFVAVLVSELNTAKTNFQYYFESDWIARNGEYRGDAAQTTAYNEEHMRTKQVHEDLQAQIDALDAAWQNSTTVDCYPIPWTTRIGSETACSKTCGPGKKTQTRAYHEPENGGQACPPPADRETQVVDCNVRDCTRTVEAATAVCAPGYTYRSSDRKCVKVSQTPVSQGCTSGFTYNSTSKYCTKTGVTSVRPTPPTGYTFNTTLGQFEMTVDPTWSCSRAGFNVDRGLLGLTYPPECVGYI